MPEPFAGKHGDVPQPVDVLAHQPTGEPSPAETWLRIVQVHDRVTRRVDSVLHRRHGLSLTGCEALRRIAASPEEWATRGELSEALGISRAGITSTVGRLVADGLVERVRGGRDKRLLHARLTEAGRERVTAAATTHDDLVGRLLAVLGDDIGPVTEALARVSEEANPGRRKTSSP